MTMYTMKFLQYNDLMKKILSEEDTLENIVDLVLDGKPSKTEKLALKTAETWSEYAFVHEKEYHVIVYKNENPIAYINNSFFNLSVDFIDYYENKLVKHLSMIYEKYNMEIVFSENRNERYPEDKMFLSKIISFTYSEEVEASCELFFKQNGLTKIFKTEINLKTNNNRTLTEDANVNISHNWIRAPKKFDDLVYLMDYKEILKPQDLDLMT
jgi:hypothetical protein